MKKRDVNEAQNVPVACSSGSGQQGTHMHTLCFTYMSLAFLFKAANACTANGDGLFALTCQQRWRETKRTSRVVLDVLKTALRACRLCNWHTCVCLCGSEKPDPEKLAKCHEMQSQHNNTDCLETHLLVLLRIPPPSLSQNEVSAWGRWPPLWKMK